MKTEGGVASHFEFCFPKMDTLLLVEVEEGGVTIRATRDTFSPQRKACFVRQLVAEGFIPDEFEWHSIEDPQSFHRGVRWLVDISWLRVDGAMAPRTRILAKALLGLAILSLALLVGSVATGRVGGRTAGPPEAHSFAGR
jgi:hypothetical protein